MPSPLFRRKSLGSLISDSDDRGQPTLQRSLGSYSLIALGLGAIVGYGALILTGILSARYAGPAILISIAISSLIAILTGLCYAELAAMVPIAGSAYIYAFATLGELPAWFVAWELLLEYSFGAAMVAWGWSGYFASLLRVLKISLPPYLSGCPWDTFVQYQGRWEEIGHILPALNAAGVNVSSLSHQHGLINLPGSLVVFLFTSILIIGIKESARSNTLLVAVKLFIIMFFIVAGILFLANHRTLIATNLHPFVPQAIKFGQFGWSGVFRASAIFFVAFLGLDAVATSSEESKNPGKDVMAGIIGSVLISSMLFSLFALVLVSTMSYKNLDIADPLAVGMDNIGLHWGSILVTLGALGALSSTLVVMLLGASRILYSVSRDKLLPSFFSQIHPKYRTPTRGTIVAGVFAAILAGIVPFDLLSTIFSVGVLTTFFVTTLAVAIMRVREPQRPRPFRAPFLPAVLAVTIPLLLFLMFFLPGRAWVRLGVWSAIGLCIYFTYGCKQRDSLQHKTAEHSGYADQEPVTPQMNLLSGLLKGMLQLFIMVLVMIAVLAIVSSVLPKIETIFPASVPTLSIFAVIAGLLTAVLPGYRRLSEDQSQNLPSIVTAVDEFIERSKEASDGN